MSETNNRGPVTRRQALGHQLRIDCKGEHPVKHLSGYQAWVHVNGYASVIGVLKENCCRANHNAPICQGHGAKIAHAKLTNGGHKVWTDTRMS